jgi:hypothetical protein
MRTANRVHRLAASLRYACHVRRKSAASSQPAKASRPVKLYSLTAEQTPPEPSRQGWLASKSSCYCCCWQRVTPPVIKDYNSGLERRKPTKVEPVQRTPRIPCATCRRSQLLARASS